MAKKNSIMKLRLPTKEEEEKYLTEYKPISAQEFIDKYITPFENDKKKDTKSRKGGKK